MALSHGSYGVYVASTWIIYRAVTGSVSHSFSPNLDCLDFYRTNLRAIDGFLSHDFANAPIFVPSTAYIWCTISLRYLFPAFPLLTFNICTTARFIHGKESHSHNHSESFPPSHSPWYPTLLTCKSSSIMLWSMHIHSSNLILSIFNLSTI